MLWSVGGCRGNVSDKKIDFIDLNQAMDLYDRGLENPEAALFIDVRKPERFNDGHIKGARNIRVNEIDLRYDADPELLKYDNLIVYGENPGSASARAMAKRMIQAGYNTVLKKRIRLFLGGWVVWESTGLPFGVVEITEPETESADESETSPGEQP
ncbi:MAG: rhodanese-like domain-containing protein [Phycisphaerales bacterium]